MKLELDHKAFTPAVAWVARHASAISSAPILGGIMLEATEDGLTLSAYDYEVSGQLDVRAAGATEPGKALVSGRMLADIAKALPAQPVYLTSEEGSTKVELSCGSSRFTLLTMPAEDYPTLPALPDIAGTIDAAAFATAVAQAAIAKVTGDMGDALPALFGMNVEIDGDRLRLATTDRFRVSLRELPWTPSPRAEDGSVTVPVAFMTGFAKAAGTEPVKLALDTGDDKNRAGLESAGRVGVSRVIAEKFPPVAKLLSGFTPVCTVEASIPDLVSAVKRVSLVNDNTTPVKLVFEPDRMTVSGGTVGKGEASETLPIKLTGEQLPECNFRPQYLVDGLGALTAGGSDTAYLQLSGIKKPAILTGAPPEDPGLDYRYMTMPIDPQRIS